MIIDELYKAVEKKGNVCVGLDTSLEYIPKDFKRKFQTEDELLFNFNKQIIDATFINSACYKVQIAYYEALGLKGLKAYKKTLEYIKSIGGISIADIKRGDIANTAKMYAKAHFEGDFESDFITLNPYMGLDSIEPYLPYLETGNKGIFPLFRTSNKGAQDFEDIKSYEDKKVYVEVSEKLSTLGERFIGECGYSSIGGVVGCTSIKEAKDLRKKFSNTFFLIPGYGAQGGGAKDAAAGLIKGNGGVVNSSRGILLAYKKHEDGEENFARYAGEEAENMRTKIQLASI